MISGVILGSLYWKEESLRIPLLLSWKKNLKKAYFLERETLNRAGRVCLVNIVLSSLLVYNMQLFLLAKGVCEEIGKVVCNFIWYPSTNYRCWHLVNWQTLISPKFDGGLGVRLADLSTSHFLENLFGILLLRRTLFGWIWSLTNMSEIIISSAHLRL